MIVNIPEGDGLLVKSEDVPRYSKRGAGFSYIIPKNGDKNVFMNCAMPFYLGSGELKTDVGCTVSYYMPQGFLMKYEMRREHLYRWQAVNKLVIKQVEKAIFNESSN